MSHYSSFSFRYFLSVVRVLFNLMSKLHQLFEIDCGNEQLYFRGQSMFPEGKSNTTIYLQQNVTSLGHEDLFKWAFNSFIHSPARTRCVHWRQLLFIIKRRNVPKPRTYTERNHTPVVVRGEGVERLMGPLPFGLSKCVFLPFWSHQLSITGMGKSF